MVGFRAVLNHVLKPIWTIWMMFLVMMVLTMIVIMTVDLVAIRSIQVILARIILWEELKILGIFHQNKLEEYIDR